MSEVPQSGPPAASWTAPPPPTSPQYTDGPVAVRGPESLGGLLLILAGIAAGVSLLLDWLQDSDVSGWGLVRSGFDDIGDAFSSGLHTVAAIAAVVQAGMAVLIVTQLRRVPPLDQAETPSH